MTDLSETLPAGGKHVVMLVSNPCDPDFRVTKEAESLAANGYRVTVLCTWRAGLDLPVTSTLNGVTYRRHFWDAAAVLRGWLGGPKARIAAQSESDPTRSPGAKDRAKDRNAPRASGLKATLQKKVRRWLSKGYAYITHWTFARTFSDPLRAERPDIIHAHDGVTLPCAARVARETGAKLVFDSHELETHRNPPLSPLRRAQVRRLERRFLPMADHVITVGERIADHLADAYPIDRPVVILNAPPSRTTDIPARWDVPGRTDIRQDAGLPEDAFVFAYTGNITVNRGLEIGLKALTHLRTLAPDGPARRFDLVAVGRCFEDQEQILRRMADVLGLADRFHILPPVAAQRVSDYISTADVSLIPILPVALSYELAMPNKLFEAMLSGNPIIGSDLTEMGALIRQEKLGLTYRPDDPEDCARRMSELVESFPEFRRDAARQADLAARYAWEAQEARLLQLYSDLEDMP